jgi:hypothetical protein
MAIKKHWEALSVVATESLHDQGLALIGNYTLRLLRVVSSHVGTHRRGSTPCPLGVKIKCVADY